MNSASKLNVSDYLRNQLILLHTDFPDTETLFTKIDQIARTNGFVTKQFLPKIIKREATYPTGLQLEQRGVAIPHTDADTIKQEFVAVIVNKTPIEFRRMDDFDQTVKAKLIFVLGLNQPHAQLDMLQALMEVIQDNNLVDQIESANNVNDIRLLLS